MPAYPFLLLKKDRLVRKIEVTGRTSIGDDESAQLRLPGTDGQWGVLFELKGKLYAQRPGGAMAELTPSDAIDIGDFTLVRADKGTRIGAIGEKAIPGAPLEVTGGKLPINRIVVMGGAPAKRSSQSIPKTGEAGATPRPAGLTQGTWGDQSPWGEGAAGVKKRDAGVADGFYDQEPILNDKTERAVAQLVKAMERNTSDPGEIERQGQDFIETLRVLTFPEIVHVLRALATAFSENHLERFYANILGRSPVLSFRWAAVIAERYAASARGFGESYALPRLQIGLPKLVSSDASDAFRTARERGAKRVANGPW